MPKQPIQRQTVCYGTEKTHLCVADSSLYDLDCSAIHFRKHIFGRYRRDQGSGVGIPRYSPMNPSVSLIVEFLPFIRRLTKQCGSAFFLFYPVPRVLIGNAKLIKHLSCKQRKTSWTWFCPEEAAVISHMELIRQHDIPGSVDSFTQQGKQHHLFGDSHVGLGLELHH